MGKITASAVFIFAICLAIEVADFAEVAKEVKACEPGFWSTPCKKCECGDKAALCDQVTGKCICETKGVIGDKCDQCDEKKRYKGTDGKCFYDIDEFIKYNFKFVTPQNANYTKMYLKLAPEDKDQNVHLKIMCVEHCTQFELKIKAYENGKEKKIVEHQKVSNKTAFEKVLSAKEFKFGMEKEKPLTHFHIQMFNFKTPVVFEVTAVPEAKIKEKMLVTMNES